jgi:hypothetical protein
MSLALYLSRVRSSEVLGVGLMFIVASRTGFHRKCSTAN